MGGPKWPRHPQFEHAEEAGIVPPTVPAARPAASVRAADLVDPRDRIDALLIHLDTFYDVLYTFSNPGMLYIATCLRQSGYRVEMLKTTDLFHLTRAAQEYVFRRARPRLVGFYTCSDNITLVRAMAADVKRWLPQAVVVVGGPLPSIDDLQVMECPSFDMAVRGEGEYVTVALMDHLVRGTGALHEIPGLTWRENGTVRQGPPPEINRDLDRLPYPEHELVGVGGHCMVVTSRGCPYACTFCFRDASGRVYRYRSALNVMGEIVRNVERYGVRVLGFVDDTFTIPPHRVRELALRMIGWRRGEDWALSSDVDFVDPQRGVSSLAVPVAAGDGAVAAGDERLGEASGRGRVRRTVSAPSRLGVAPVNGRDFAFFCEGRVDVLDRHPDLLPLLIEAGLTRLQIGIESGNRETLALYRKRLEPETVLRLMKRCGELPPLSVVGNFILGAPFENRRSFDTTLAFAVSLLQASPGVFEGTTCYLAPYPGTEIEQNPTHYGLRLFDGDFKRGLTLSDVHYETSELRANEIRALGTEFENVVMAEMWKLGPRIPRHLVAAHFGWAKRFSMMTMWYLRVLSRASVLEEYFRLLSGARFRPLDEVPADRLLDWFPMRVIERRRYTKSGRLQVGGWFRNIYLVDPIDRTIYELSAGKLRLREIAQEVQSLHCPHHALDEIVRGRMLTLYRRLEQSYHVIFFE